MMPTITAFTCVRDAAWSIEAWYDNVKDHADAIIIQDGGSTDGTREIIMRWANDPKVTILLQNEDNNKFKWNEQVVRNQCLGVFKTDWILLMDADELIEDRFWDWFNATNHNDPERIGYYIAHKNLWLNWNMFRMDGWWPDLTLRLFKNHRGWFWRGAEHASLWHMDSNLGEGGMAIPSDPTTPIAGDPEDPISFVHYHRAEPGYGPAVMEDRTPHHSNEQENLKHLVDPYVPRPVLARLRQHPTGAGKIRKRFEDGC